MNLSLLLVVVLGALLVFMMYNSRKRQRRQAEEMSTKLGPGAKVMTTFGVFGTVISVDEEENQVLLESGPGTQLKVHRQAVGKIIEGAPSLDAGAAPLGVRDDDLGDVSVPDDASSLTEGLDRPEVPEYGKYADDDVEVPAGPEAADSDLAVDADLSEPKPSDDDDVAPADPEPEDSPQEAAAPDDEDAPSAGNATDGQEKK